MWFILDNHHEKVIIKNITWFITFHWDMSSYVSEKPSNAKNLWHDFSSYTLSRLGANWQLFCWAQFQVVSSVWLASWTGISLIITLRPPTTRGKYSGNFLDLQLYLQMSFKMAWGRLRGTYQTKFIKPNLPSQIYRVIRGTWQKLSANFLGLKSADSGVLLSIRWVHFYQA